MDISELPLLQVSQKENAPSFQRTPAPKDLSLLLLIGLYHPKNQEIRSNCKNIKIFLTGRNL